jgi:metallo-beta-lactamase superfamily protein
VYGRYQQIPLGRQGESSRPAAQSPAGGLAPKHLVVVAAGSVVRLQRDTDEVWAGDSDRPAGMRLVHSAVFDFGGTEVFFPVLQLGVARYGQTEQRESAQSRERRGGASQQQTDTARMLQQHRRNLVFAFLHQESAETEYVYHTGAGNGRRRPPMPALDHLDIGFLEDVRAAGFDYNDVDVVINTHIHSDHVGWNTKLENGTWVPTFPNARYLMPAPDYRFFPSGRVRGEVGAADRA